MAERRMFAKNIVQSSRFLKMPVSSRELYFQLGMAADDDGIVEAWNVMKITNATEDDLRVLVSKGFVRLLNNEDLITYLTDWNTNNQIRKDRKHDSIYKNLLLGLPENVCDNQLTTKCQPTGNQLTTKCQPIDVKCETEDRIDKDRIGKVSLGKVRIDNCMTEKPDSESENINPSIELNYEELRNKWNTLSEYGVKELRILGPKTDRAKKLKACIEQFGLDSFNEVINEIKQSDYLLGKTDRTWGTEFVWVIEIENYTKILEGYYRNKGSLKPKNKNSWPDINRPPENYAELEARLLDN